MFANEVRGARAGCLCCAACACWRTVRALPRAGPLLHVPAHCTHSRHRRQHHPAPRLQVLVCYLLPIHVGLHRAYHLFTTVIHEGAPPARCAALRCAALGHAAGCRRPGAGLAPVLPGLPAHTALRSAAALRTHAGGHAGYEVAPFIPSLESLAALLLLGRRPAPALNTVRHHDMHHRFPRTHFSLYMTHWDRWCGTEHPAYRADVAAHFEEAAEEEQQQAQEQEEQQGRPQEGRQPQRQQPQSRGSLAARQLRIPPAAAALRSAVCAS